jgi:hypothetical protein
VLPLTPLQAGLLFHALLDAGAPVDDPYTVQLQLVLEGQLEPARLRRAATVLLHRHRAVTMHAIYYFTPGVVSQASYLVASWTARAISWICASESAQARRLQKEPPLDAG